MVAMAIIYVIIGGKQFLTLNLRLLQTFAGVLQKIHTHCFQANSNYIKRKVKKGRI